jgi:hypothetical protein
MSAPASNGHNAVNAEGRLVHKEPSARQFDHLIGASGVRGVRTQKGAFPEAVVEAMQRSMMKFVRCATVRAGEIAISELRRAP